MSNMLPDRSESKKFLNVFDNTFAVFTKCGLNSMQYAHQHFSPKLGSNFTRSNCNL